ncbi:MAG: NAD(P)(+) transhydrogenase (Re/Si-specific) subunit beta [Bdellovibrionales bacterium]|nr:NAD(P)(+) transhydrogenase (Re/Si-specific) subunit beta [Bdellovibrionales bacterium]
MNLELNPNLFALVYLIATIFFIFGLKGLSSPKTALRGNGFAMLGMGLAIGATLLNPEVRSYTWILAGLAAGAVIGIPLALKIQMTSMPELVAALHSFVGLSAVFVAFGTYFKHLAHGEAMDGVLMSELAVGSFIGAITFTGSVVAFGKLKGSFGSNPVTFPGQHLLNLVMALGMIGFTADFVMHDRVESFYALTALAFVLGVTLVIPIGGADMPVVVSMLNSYSGWAASATGFTLQNNLLITTGALVGSSGAILSYIMCKAMNRSFFSVILGGFGGEASAASPMAAAAGKGVKSAAVEDAAFVLGNSTKVIIVPGYGMAVAQAQHAVKELWQALVEKGVDVTFATHPVAGRMPGHMNVLLAESEIPYDVVQELEEINPDFASTDAVLIIGANDVVNPAAKTDKSSPLYGMPILDAYKAKQVFLMKRSLKAGYAGVDNALYYYDNCALVFGDAKAACESLTAALHEA